MSSALSDLDRKVSELDSLTDVDVLDLLYIVDVSAGAAGSKKVYPLTLIDAISKANEGDPGLTGAFAFSMGNGTALKTDVPNILRQIYQLPENDTPQLTDNLLLESGEVAGRVELNHLLGSFTEAPPKSVALADPLLTFNDPNAATIQVQDVLTAARLAPSKPAPDADDMLSLTQQSDSSARRISWGETIRATHVQGARNIYDYGATGDGVTNDTDAFKAVIAGIGENGLVIFPPGHFVFNETIDLPVGCSVEMRGAVLDWSSQTVYPGNLANLRFSSGEDPLPALASDASAGDDQFTFATAHGLQVGDVFSLLDPNDFSFCGFRANCKTKEHFLVAEVVSATVVRTTSRAYYDWSTLACTPAALRRKWSSTLCGDGEIIGSEANTGSHVVIFSRVPFPRISGSIRVHGGYSTAVNVESCYGGVVQGLEAMKPASDLTGTSYGLVVNASQNIVVRDSVLHGNRHGMAVGGTGHNLGINVDGCYLSATQQSGADFHPNVAYSSYRNCVIDNGVYLGGEFNTIENCVIRRGSQGQAIGLAENKSLNHRLVNNELFGVDGDTYGVLAANVPAECAEDGVLIVDTLRVRNDGGQLGCAIRVQGAANVGKINARVSNVVQDIDGAAPTLRGIDFITEAGATPDFVTIVNCRAAGTIRVQGALDATVHNCSVHEPASHAIDVNTVTNAISVLDCHVAKMTANNNGVMVGGSASGNCKHVHVANIEVQGAAAGRRVFEGFYADVMTVDDIRYDASPASYAFYFNSNVTDVIFKDTDIVGGASQVYEGAANQIRTDMLRADSTIALACKDGSTYIDRIGAVGGTVLYVREGGAWVGK